MAERTGRPKAKAEPAAEPPPHQTLLHRMADNLRTQNWTAIGLEFLVVVFGVFLGLQATNWNAGLSDRRDEAEALREIAADIRQDRQEMGAARNVLLHRVSAMREVLTQARGEAPDALNVLAGFDSDDAYVRVTVPDGPALSAQERAALWSVIVSTYYPSPASPSFDSLIASGRVDILRDEALVRDIQTYRLVSSYLVATQNQTLRPISVTVRERGERHGLSSFGLVDEADLVRRVRDSEDLEAMIESQLGWAIVHLQRIDDVDQRGTALLTRLEASGVD